MNTKRHFLALDGLRGVAAIAVAIGHLVPIFGLRVSYGNTALAVDFFFMLSGFVLAHAYGRRLDEGGGFLSYFCARVIRLYPLIIFATSLAAVPLIAKLLLQSDSAIPFPILAKLTIQGVLLIPELRVNPIGDSFLPLNPPAWSLFFEMIASTLYGIGVLRGRLIWSIVIWIISVASILLVAHYGSFDTGFKYYTIHLGMARVAFGFTTGVLLYRFWSNHQIGIPPAIFLGLALVLPIYLLSSFVNSAFQLSFVLLFCPTLIIAGAAYRLNSFRLIPYWSGEISYPLYIIHWPIYVILKTFIKIGHLNIAGTPLGLTAIALAISVSVLALKFFDKPIRRYLRTLLLADD